MGAAEFFTEARAILALDTCPVGRAWDRGTSQERKALAVIAGYGAFLPEWLWQSMTVAQQIETKKRMADEWRIQDRAWRQLTQGQREAISMAARGAGRWLAGCIGGSDGRG